MQEAIIIENSLLKNTEVRGELLPPFCFDCRNAKNTACKKKMKPKGKFGGGFQCKRYHPKGN